MSPRLCLPARAARHPWWRVWRQRTRGKCGTFGCRHLWVLRLVKKAVKPATTPSATRMAVRGLWREAWDSAQFTCCTGHRDPLLLERRAYVLVGEWGYVLLCGGAGLRLPLCARASCKKLCAGGVWSISTLHVGPDQLDLRRNPNPKPNPNPNPDPNPNLLWSSRSARAVTRLGDVFPKNNPGGPIDQPRSIKHVSCTTCFAECSCT